MPSGAGQASRARRIVSAVLSALGLTAKASDALNRSRYAFQREFRKQNEAFARTQPDGAPLPPPGLVFLVTGTYDVRKFYESGPGEVARIVEVLERNGIDRRDMRRVLDFGCGCGRIIRHWPRDAELFGCDYNAKLIDWCRAELTFATFAVNNLEPPLPYEDASLDLIYSYSVFTHFPRELQRAWLAELHRCLAPGGYAYVTVHGTNRRGKLRPEDLPRFDAGELVVVNERLAGRNQCNAYHPDPYVRNEFVTGLFEVVDHFVPPKGDRWAQDGYLLRKTAP